MNSAATYKPVFNKSGKAIIDLILPIQQNEFNVPVTLEAQPDLLDIEKHYHAGGGGFWGAFIDDELVGSIGLLNIGHNAGAIRKMFVKKDYRGASFGIGQTLLNTLLTYARSNQMTDIYLGTVGVLQAAIRFYEKNGFVKTEVEALPVYFPRMAADHIFYHLSLKQDS
jgi:GNAT superfamily N-acetyltransferase